VGNMPGENMLEKTRHNHRLILS